MPSTDGLSPSTIAVTSGRPPREPGRPLNTPISPATALIPGGDTEYARDGNPGWSPFEQVLGDLEGGYAVAFSSGMGAISAVVDIVPRDGKVVAPRSAYSGTLTLLKERATRGFLELELVDIDNTLEVVRAMEGADMIWVETPTNPTLLQADLDAIGRAAVTTGTAVVVDNTFATPLRQRPLDHGAHVVVHSASKLLSGHSDVLLGAVVVADERAQRTFLRRRTRLGATPGTLETYLAARGTRTLHVRLDRAEANAKELHARLQRSHQVVYSRYPGFGTIVSFEVAGGPEAADKVTGLGQIIVNATSLGGVESTWERRRRHSAEPDTVPDGLIRLSVGIEDVDDLWADVEQALRAL